MKSTHSIVILTALKAYHHNRICNRDRDNDNITVKNDETFITMSNNLNHMILHICSHYKIKLIHLKDLSCCEKTDIGRRRSFYSQMV